MDILAQILPLHLRIVEQVPTLLERKLPARLVMKVTFVLLLKILHPLHVRRENIQEPVQLYALIVKLGNLCFYIFVYNFT